MRKKIPERNLEPPENYMQEPPFCEDCKEDECLLDLNKECPEWDKADRATHAEWLESKEDNSAPQDFIEAYDTFIAEQAQQEKPSEKEKEHIRQRVIDFEILEKDENIICTSCEIEVEFHNACGCFDKEEGE